MAEWPAIPEGAGYPLVDAETGEFLSSLIKAWYASKFVSADQVTITEVANGWNYKAGHPDNRIAPDVLGSIIAGDGTPGREIVIGKGVIENVNTPLSNVPTNPADLLEADPNKRANHSFSVGYDSVLAGLKSVCLADHAYIRSGATHNSILGGAVHGIDVGDFNVIGGGYRNFIRDADYSVIMGGIDNEINVPSGGNVAVGGSRIKVIGSSSAAFGSDHLVAGQGAFVTGILNETKSNYSQAHGLEALARHVGQRAYGIGKFTALGDAQASDQVQKLTTTTATEGYLGNAYGLLPGQTIHYRTMITARDTGNGDSKTWELAGSLKRFAGANAAIVGGGSTLPAATVRLADTGAAAWNVRAAPSGASLIFFVTGAAGRTIQWVARTELVEVGA